MQIGVPKEIINNEYRVGLTPASVRELVSAGHRVLIETHLGEMIGFTDELYRMAGAEVLDSSEAVFRQAELIVKVKGLQPEECRRLRKDQLLMTFLHLAVDPEQTKLLLASGVIAFAYETVTDNQGGLPLLTPMSEVAGRMSIQAGASCLEKVKGGRGILLGGVPGVPPAKVVVIGGGVVGTEALRIALGMGADVFVLDKSLKRLRELDALFQGRVSTCYATQEFIDHYVVEADLVIGAVLVPGGKAPKLVSRAVLKKMRFGSVMVDVSIDQGGCFETSRPTTYSDPTYVEEGIVHYCVTNMPGGVPHTSALALNHATLPFILELANKGVQRASRENVHLRQGLNIYDGNITHKAVAQSLNLPYTPAEVVLGI